MNKRLVRIISALLALLMTAGLFPVSAMAENLLYTAVTRAKKYVVLVGSKKYISMMIHNNFIITRNTMLKHFLTKEQAKYDSLYGDILK